MSASENGYSGGWWSSCAALPVPAVNLLLPNSGASLWVHTACHLCSFQGAALPSSFEEVGSSKLWASHEIPTLTDNADFAG